MKKLLFPLLLTFFISAYAQKEILVKAIPADAEIYQKYNNGREEKKGVGSFTLKIDKDVVYTFEARRDGWVPVQKSIVRQKDGLPQVILKLEDRRVIVNASPPDAHIYVNSGDRGTGPVEVVIPKEQSATVEVKKPGYYTVTKTYYNKDGQDGPESSRLFKLETRLVSVKAYPADSKIFVDEKKVGEGSADVIIPKDACVNVKVEHLGYATETATYCNKDNEAVPPLSSQITLKDRTVQVNTMPEDASIYVDGKEVGKGSTLIKLPEGKTTQVFIRRISFVPEKLQLYNVSDMQAPEPVYAVKLKADEAFQESEESNVANHNFGIEVSSQYSESDAWKMLSSIIMAKFDEIENIDATSGYLRTNWVGKTYNANTAFPSTVRTRVIVTKASLNPLKYNLKIQSEKTKVEEKLSNDVDIKCLGANLNDDQCFAEFPRILRKYNDLITEAQRRLSEK